MSHQRALHCLTFCWSIRYNVRVSQRNSIKFYSAKAAIRQNEPGSQGDESDSRDEITEANKTAKDRSHVPNDGGEEADHH